MGKWKKNPPGWVKGSKKLSPNLELNIFFFKKQMAFVEGKDWKPSGSDVYTPNFFLLQQYHAMVFPLFSNQAHRGKGGTKRQNSLPSPPTKNAKRVESTLGQIRFGTLIEHRIFMRATNLCQKTNLFPPKKSHPWFKPESHIPEISHPTKIDSWNPNN